MDKTGVKRSLLGCATLVALTLGVARGDEAEGLVGYSMLTRDGRRLVSKMVKGTRTFELVPTNALPANLPPVRPWTIYGIKSAHSDLGLHRSNFIQRKGTVLRIDEAGRLMVADRRTDDDPAAMRYVIEGWWSWLNYPLEKGEPVPKADLDHAYEALLLNDDHSYGFSGYTGRRVYDTWAQHRDWIEFAERVSGSAERRSSNTDGSTDGPSTDFAGGLTAAMSTAASLTIGYVYFSKSALFALAKML